MSVYQRQDKEVLMMALQEIVELNRRDRKQTSDTEQSLLKVWQMIEGLREADAKLNAKLNEIQWRQPPLPFVIP